MMLAFGAGALLFAVTVELYGHALMQVHTGHIGMIEMFTTILGALIGSALYLIINKWLERYLKSDGMQERQISNSTSDGMQERQTSNSTTEDEEKPAPLPSESDSLAESMRAQKIASSQSEIATQTTQTTPSLSCRVIEQLKNAVSPRVFPWDRPQSTTSVRGRGKAMRHSIVGMQSPRESRHAKSVAFALFLGLLLDGVPEGILMGFLSAEGHLTPVLIVSLFVANFPEAFSSASLMLEAHLPASQIIGMWSGLCVLVGCLAWFSCWSLLLFFPEFGHGGFQSTLLPMPVLLGIALIEGITGGAMIACIASVMLPEAFDRVGKSDGAFYTQSGFLCTSGFLTSVALKTLFG